MLFAGRYANPGVTRTDTVFFKRGNTYFDIPSSPQGSKAFELRRVVPETHGHRPFQKMTILHDSNIGNMIQVDESNALIRRYRLRDTQKLTLVL